jgi:hypothetical protein
MRVAPFLVEAAMTWRVSRDAFGQAESDQSKEVDLERETGFEPATFSLEG